MEQQYEEETHDNDADLPETRAPGKHDIILAHRNGCPVAGQGTTDTETATEDSHAAQRTRLERSTTNTPPTDTHVLETLREKMNALPKSKQAPAPPTDPETLTVRQALDESSHLQLLLNKRLDSYADREESLKEKLSEWQATVVQTQTWIKEVWADGADKKKE